MSGGPGWHLREMLEVKRCRIGDCEQENMHGSDLMFPSCRLYLPTLFENEQLLHPAPHRAGGRSSPAHPAPPPPSLLWEIIPQMANYFATWRPGEEEGTGLSAQLQGNVLKYPFAPQNALDVPGSARRGWGAGPAGTFLVRPQRWQEGLGRQSVAGSWIQAPLAKNVSPSGVLAPPGSAPGVPLRSPAAEAVAALPGAVDEALSVFAFLLDGGVQNGLVQEVDLVDVPPCDVQR